MATIMRLKRVSVIVLIGLLSMTTGCGDAAVKETMNVTEQPVKQVITTKMSSKYVVSGLEYLGYVKAKDTKKYAFLTAGQIAEVCVEKGQKIKKGDILARLDTTQLQLAIANSDETIQIAQKALEKNAIQIESAQETLKVEQNALKHITDNYDVNISGLEKTLKLKEEKLQEMKELYEYGGAAKAECDSLQAEYDIALENLENTKNNKLHDLEVQEAKIETCKLNIEALQAGQSNEQIEQAKIAKEKYVKNIEEATLIADTSGIVLEVPFKRGEVVNAGVPVVCVKGEKEVISIGVSVEDYHKIALGDKVIINDKTSGKISMIAAYPDETTKTYEVEITPNQDATYEGTSSFVMGDIVDVEIVQKENKGYFIPIKSIFNVEGLDYVYIVDGENKIKRIQIKMGEIKGEEVEVQGLSASDIVVTEGMKNLKENEVVTVKESEA